MTNQPLPTRAELSRLRAEVAELRAELAQTRHELQVLQSRRATRAGEALRQGRRAGAVKGTLAAVGELRRPSVTPEKLQVADDGPTTPGRLRSVRRLRDAGDLDAAIEETRAILLDHPDDPEALDLQVGLQMGAGLIGGALSSAQRLARVDDSPRLRARRRRIAGTLRALDPRFAPYARRLPASERTGPALVLLPPGPSQGGAILDTDRRGFEEFVGALRVLTDHEVRTVGAELGAHYPRTGPLDEVLTDAATALGNALAMVHPLALVALISDEAPEAAIVGRSVADALSIPFVVVRPDARDQRIANTHANARLRLTDLTRAAGDRLAEHADGIVGADDHLTAEQAADVTAELLAHLTATGSR